LPSVGGRRCPQHYTAPRANAAYWEEKVARNRARDIRVDTELQEQNWDVIRIWEHELREDLEGIAESIVQQIARLRTRTSSPQPPSPARADAVAPARRSSD
jgi:DNA mismatch endonuclease (patch repair protein)